MKKLMLLFTFILLCSAFMLGCTQQSEDCYAAAIIVEGVTYYKTFGPMPGEIDSAAIIGYTVNVSDTFPKKNGETNFGTKNMPYAKVQDGIAVLHENEWYLCTPDK